MIYPPRFTDDHGVRSRFQPTLVLRLRLLALAEIVDELRKLEQISDWVAQRGEGDTRQESCAVFPHAHALFFVSVACCGQSEYLLRSA